MNRIELEPVDRVEITVLMDNVTDPLLVDQQAVARMSWPKALAGGLPTAGARVSPDTGVPDALIAEPGFSALVRIEKAGRQRTLLFDTGVSVNGMVENMRRLGIAVTDVEVIVLSHGHWDHVTGMEGLVRALGRTRLPVMIHPEFWNRRRVSFPGLEPAELPSTSRSALQGMGFVIVEERQPSFLLDGAVLITGEVDRTTAFETGFQGHEALPRRRVASRPAHPRRSGARGQPRGPGASDSLRGAARADGPAELFRLGRHASRLSYLASTEPVSVGYGRSHRLWPLIRLSGPC
jgi:7,8-dihydropterin-6-yl-methyl-4-(beta-D-ribofuranosyl)aminobenzene 5'-phosphate synthase